MNHSLRTPLKRGNLSRNSSCNDNFDTFCRLIGVHIGSVTNKRAREGELGVVCLAREGEISLGVVCLAREGELGVVCLGREGEISLGVVCLYDVHKVSQEIWSYYVHTLLCWCTCILQCGLSMISVITSLISCTCIFPSPFLSGHGGSSLSGL